MTPFLPTEARQENHILTHLLSPEMTLGEQARPPVAPAAQ